MENAHEPKIKSEYHVLSRRKVDSGTGQGPHSAHTDTGQKKMIIFTFNSQSST